MKESTYTILFLDTETTGNTKEDRICQLSFKKPGESIDSMFDNIYKTPLPITFEAMAIHHITNEMTEYKPLFTESKEYSDLKTLFEDDKTIIVAHNARFDMDMIKKENIFPSHFIDTLKITRALDPQGILPRHNLQYLRYKLGLYKLITEKISPHDAKSDVIVLELLFNRVFDKTLKQTGNDVDKALQEMMRVSLEPTLIQKISFGKYKDSLISELVKTDRGYLEWLLKEKKKTPEEEEDWIYTLVYHLEGKDKADAQFHVAEQPLFSLANNTKAEAVPDAFKSVPEPAIAMDQFIPAIGGLMPTHDEVNIDEDLPDLDDDGEEVKYDEYSDKLDTIEF